MTLTHEQNIVVNLSEGDHLVLAAPGTGKTELLARRIVKALERGVLPQSVLCLTFTVKAAQNMLARIREHLPNVNIEVGNVHNYCARFLFAAKIIPQNSSIIDAATQVDLMTELVEHLGQNAIEALKAMSYDGSIPIKRILSACCSLRQLELQFPETLFDHPSQSNIYQKYPEIIERLKTDYRALKSAYSMLDFDDLLNDTYYWLSNNSENTVRLFKWVQIDEVQDLNPLQWAIIERLKAPNAHTVYLGDMEQAIFSFMGASSQQLNEIASTCQLHNLQINFRSPSYLLDLYVRYALKNLNPKWDNLPLPAAVQTRAPTDLQLLQLGTKPADEFNQLSDHLVSHQSAHQTAILVRYNDTADRISQVLTRRGLTVCKVSGYDLFDRAFMRDLKAYFSTAISPYDKLGWSRMFKLFGTMSTQKEARGFAHELFSHGYFPSDFLNPEASYATALQTVMQSWTHDRIVVFDTETTGIDTDADDIIQIAAVEYIEGKRGTQLDIYLKTGRSLAATTDIHHITDHTLAQYGKPPAEGFDLFCRFVGTSTLIAHNMPFDLCMLKANFKRNGIAFPFDKVPLIDTLEITRRLFPTRTSFTLEDLIKDFALEGMNTHNALDDVLATGALVAHLANVAKERSQAQARFARDHADRLLSFRNNMLPLWSRLQSDPNFTSSFGIEATHFFEYCIAAGFMSAQESTEAEYKDAIRFEIARFIRFTNEKYGTGQFLSLLSTYRQDLQNMKESDLIMGDEPFVVSTVHKAKGLEFERVVIPNCVPGVFPCFGQDDAEEARLLYVAMTRAKHQLIIAYHGENLSNFMAEIRTCFSSPSDVYCQHPHVVPRQHQSSAKDASLLDSLKPFNSPDWLVRYLYAQQVGNQAKPPHDHRHLLALLSDSDWSVVLSAIKACAKLNLRSASPQIVACLAHTHIRVQCEACDALGKMKLVEALAQIRSLALMSDQDAVVLHCIYAITAMACGSSVVTLVDVFRQGSPEVRWACIDALDAFSEFGVEEHLKRAVLDVDPRVRLRAAKILDSTGKTALGNIIEGNSGDWHRLGTSGLGNMSRMHELLEIARFEEAIKCLGAMDGNDALEALIALGSKTDLSPFVLALLCEAFGKHGSPDCLTVLRKLARHQHPSVRRAVASALGRIVCPEASKILLFCLSDTDSETRVLANESLCAHGDSRWSGIVTGEDYDFVRLGDTGESSLVPLLVYRLKDGSLRRNGGSIRNGLAQSLAKLGRPEYEGIFLGDDNDWYRLCRTPPADSKPLVAELLTNRESGVRLAAARAMRDFGEPVYVTLVLGDVRDWERVNKYRASLRKG